MMTQSINVFDSIWIYSLLIQYFDHYHFYTWLLIAYVLRGWSELLNLETLKIISKKLVARTLLALNWFFIENENCIDSFSMEIFYNLPAMNT